MKRLFRPAFHLLALLLLALPACQRPEDPTPPADLLPKEKMIGLLTELHMLEAQVENSRLTADSARALFMGQHKDLLWRQQVSDSAFQRSYRYYAIHGKDLDEIYGAVIDSLARREFRLAAANPQAAPPTPPPPPIVAPAPVIPGATIK